MEDKMNKSGVKHRDLNILVWLTCNDVGRVYMDQKGRYLKNMLVKMHHEVAEFDKKSKRVIRLNFLPFIHAPHLYDHHPVIDSFNDKVRTFNKAILLYGTYEIDMLLAKVPKTGEPIKINIKGKKFASPDLCWRIQSTAGSHLSNLKMAEVLSDLRKFCEDDLNTSSDSPSLEREPTVQFGEKPLPRKTRPAEGQEGNQGDDQIELQDETAQPTISFAGATAKPPPAATSQSRSTEKRPGSSFRFRDSKFPKQQTQRQRQYQDVKDKQRDEAKQSAIQRSLLDETLANDDRWKDFLQEDSE